MAAPSPSRGFAKFPSLPTELQLKIFRTFSNSNPRTLDIWTDWKKCDENNTVFYVQYYSSELSPRVPPPVLLSVSRAARAECLKCYSHEFRCSMTISRDVRVEMPASMYINFNVDTIVPRGHWNIVSFEDLAFRVEGRMRSIAVDVGTGFWKDNLRDYCRKRCWILNGVREVLLYDSTSEEVFKGSEYLDKFRRKEVGKKDLSFVPLVVEEGESVSEEARKLKEVEAFLVKVFGVIDGSGSIEGVDEDHEFGFVRKAEFIAMMPTMKEEFKRPVIKLMKLITATPKECV
ncbi:hypothetical protein BKA65DRAFT_518605 [Rhexocercosporidium sp. MPI-PUGE-AT-0058]|nr:hypothetical protein BKA65DRAFT_518605 [Rhexocercosporidium sp. MPI-PUGE-AT-0058]